MTKTKYTKKRQIYNKQYTNGALDKER